MKIADMPPGPASTWEDRPLARFLKDLERLEDAVAQFVQVAVPDLIEADLTPHSIHMVYDRIAGTVAQLLTAIDHVGREQASPR